MELVWKDSDFVLDLGDNKYTLMAETEKWNITFNIYGSTKASSTIIAHQFASEHGFNMVTLRPFGTFGEGEEPHKLFCHIILNVLQNKDVDLTPCEQFRDYCYIENIIDGLLLVAQNKRIQNEIFNIGSGEGYPLKHHVEYG